MCENSLNNCTKENIIYSINEETKTAKVIGTEILVYNIFIPHSINHESQEYIVTSISRDAFSESTVQTVNFPNDSAVKTIEKNAFWGSSIKRIFIPSSITNLEDGWCDYTQYLTEIEVSSENPRYSKYGDKFIIGKSTLEQENYDVLVFAVRDIKETIIPNFIEIIGSYSFSACNELFTIEFPPDSKVKEIQEFAFSDSTINYLKIPSNVTRIGKSAFHGCVNFTCLHAPEDSELVSIGELCFSGSSIENIIIPSKLVELNDRWCHNVCSVVSIYVMPKNPYFICYNEQFLLKKSSIENENYDVLCLAVRNIQKAMIPSFVEIIDNCAFEMCFSLLVVCFNKDSNLRLIGQNGFYSTPIEEIKLPCHLSKIDIFAFFKCKNLKKVDIPKNSDLEFIGKRAFSNSSIESFYITSHVKEIGDFAFESCNKLQIIEFDENSELKTLKRCVFNCTYNVIVMIPVKVKELKFILDPNSFW